MAFNLSISPPQLEIFVAPGQSITQAYKITNNDSLPLTLTASVETWEALGADGSVHYLDSAHAAPFTLVNFDLANADVKLKQPFVLAPLQSRQIVLRIKAKAGVKGDSYHTLFLTQVDPLNPTKTAAITSGQIGSHVLISVSPTEQVDYQAKASNLIASPTFKDVFFTPLHFSALVENQSDFYLKTIGHLVISKGNVVFKDFTLAPLNVAAHHERTIMCQNDNQSPTACTLDPPFWPGVYTATLNLDNSLNSQPLTISFFVFPYYAFFALVLISTLILTYLKINRSKKS